MTVSYTFWLSVIAVDLLAYQCGGSPKCPSGRWWLAPFEDDSFGAPPRRIVLGTVVVAFILWLLASLAGITLRRQAFPVTPQEAEANGSGLSARTFWSNQEPESWLAKLHLSAAFAFSSFILAYSVGQIIIFSILDLLAILSLAVLAVSVIAIVLPKRVTDNHALSRLPLGVLVLSLALLGLTMFWITALPNTYDYPIGRLPGFGQVQSVVFGFQLSLLCLLGLYLAVGAVPLRRALKVEGQRRFRWAAPLLSSTIAIILLDAVFSLVALWMANFLGLGTQQESRLDAPLQEPVILYSSVYEVLALSLAPLLLIPYGWLIQYWRMNRRSSDKSRLDQVESEYAKLDQNPASGPQSGGDAPFWMEARKDRAWCRNIVIRRLAVRKSESGDLALTFLVALFVVAIPILALIDLPDFVIAALTFIPILLLSFLRKAFTSQEIRRKLGILWDILSFWPRLYHPLAPLCYAERAVPELEYRVNRLINNGAHVLLMAHSQGTAIAVAALVRLRPEVLSRVALVTYGSPLVKIYQKAFPTFFGPELFRTLISNLVKYREAGDGWINFYRSTDPISGPLFVNLEALGGKDYSLPDPETSWHPIGDDQPKTLGHSGYLDDHTFVRQTTELRTSLTNAK